MLRAIASAWEQAGTIADSRSGATEQRRPGWWARPSPPSRSTRSQPSAGTCVWTRSAPNDKSFPHPSTPNESTQTPLADEVRTNGFLDRRPEARRHRALDRRAQLPGAQLHARRHAGRRRRSEEHTSELQSLMRISYAVFSLKKKNNRIHMTQKTARK